MKKKKVWTYVISIAIALAVGGLSALLSHGGMQDYAALRQPPFAPPGIVFPIVWSVLFVLMGISAAIIFLSDSEKKGAALTVYAIQLFVNFFWSIIFFGLEKRLFAFIWLLILLALVIIMTAKFSRISRPAAILQIPYLAWLIFAAYLNLAVWLLNR